MAEIDPTRINQKSIEQDVTPDGNPIGQSAAPQSTQRPPASANAGEVTLKDLPVVDDGKAISDGGEPSADAQAPKADEPAPVDFTDFLKASADLKDIPTEAAKPAVKPEAPKADEPEEPLVVAPQQHQPQQPQGRDYSDLSAEVVPLFKKMGNEAFNAIKPIFKEHSELKKQVNDLKAEVENRKKGAIPDSYYEHPQAYVLTPEFNSASQRVNLAQTIVNHWQEQYTKIREGAAEFDNLGQDPKGNLVITGKVKADPSAETTVLGFINATQQQLFKEQGKLEALSMTHQEKYKQSNDWLGNHEKQAFSIFETPEGQQYLPKVNEMLNQFPAPLRNNPLARVLVKSEMVNLYLAGELQKLKGNNGSAASSNQQQADPRQQRLAAIKKSAGPVNGDVGGSSGNSNGKQAITLDDYEAVKNSY